MTDLDRTSLAGGGGGDRDVIAAVRDAFRRIQKHWAVVLAVTAVVALVATFRTLGETRIYESSATVLFDPNPPRPLGRSMDMAVDMEGSYWTNKEFYETQYKLMTSTRVAMDVADHLQLHRDAAFLSNAPPDKKVPAREVDLETAAYILQGRVEVSAIKNSRLAILRYRDADPARAQRIAGAMVDSYVAKNLEDMVNSTSDAAEWLNDQLGKLKDGLDQSSLALHEYKQNKNILSVDIDAQSNMLREQMRQLSDALTAVRIKRQELAARYEELRNIKSEEPADLPVTELLQSQVLAALRKDYVDAQREVDALVATGKGKNHPEAQAAESRVQIARKALLTEVRNIQGALARDLSAAQRQEKGLSGLFEGAKKQALDLNLLEIEYSKLARTKGNNEKLYGLVLERTKESDLTRMLRVNNVRVVERPRLPGAPVSPNVPRNIVMGLLAGLLLGIGAAITREALDRTVKTQDDLEGQLGLNFLGIIPSVNEGAKKSGYYGRKRKKLNGAANPGNPDLVVHEFPLSGVAEAARAIRTNIMFMSPDKPFRKLLVTSPGPSEGKTTVACCIAIAMAQAGQRVALIDCDLRRPRVHRAFGISSDPGVTSALIDTKAIEANLMESEVPNLTVIPAGPIPPNPAEILQSERFRALLASLEGKFDRLVIDSPPVGPVTDAAILSTQVDGVVLVVRAFGTMREHARQAKRAIVDVGGRVVGSVLNAVNLDKSEYKHYHYAYYKRSGYYTSKSEAPPARNDSDRPASDRPQTD